MADKGRRETLMSLSHPNLSDFIWPMRTEDRSKLFVPRVLIGE
jgi:hypothetical protein